jgi:hypothetical protein
MKSLEQLNGPVRANIAPAEDGTLYYRLLIKILDEKHFVYVGNDSTRIFTPDTLPSMLKHRLAIIKSRPQSDNQQEEIKSSMLGLFMQRPHKVEDGIEMDVIGWCGAKGMYIVIVSEEELNHIRIST